MVSYDYDYVECLRYIRESQHLVNEGSIADAKKVMQIALEKFPNDIECYLEYYELLMRTGDIDLAKDFRSSMKKIFVKNEAWVPARYEEIERLNGG